MDNEIINQEEELVVLLSQPFLNAEQEIKFKYLLESYLNWDKVIGMIELHRIAGLAWKNVQKYFFNNDSNRCTCNRLYKYLYNSYKINTIRANEQLNYTYDVCNVLKKNNIKYVLLKGIVISSGLYGDIGLRDFNDNDILISPKDVNAATNLILQLGYLQGESKHLSKIKKTTRKEKITRSLTSHEVIPFIKNLSPEANFSPQHIVDLHFSINLMSGKRTDNIVEKWIEDSIEINIQQKKIYTLKWENMLLFLCEHFYKEATSSRDLTMYKDLLLYKLCDIHYLILFKKINLEELLTKTKEFELEKQVYFTLKYLEDVFNVKDLKSFIEKIKPKNTSFLNHVYYYNSDKIAYEHTNISLNKRFFDIKKPEKIN